MLRRFFTSLANLLDVPPVIARRYAVLLLLGLLLLGMRMYWYWQTQPIENEKVQAFLTQIQERQQYKRMEYQAYGNRPNDSYKSTKPISTRTDLNQADSLAIAATGLFGYKIQKLLRYRAKAGAYTGWQQIASLKGFSEYDVRRLQKQFYIDSIKAQKVLATVLPPSNTSRKTTTDTNLTYSYPARKPVFSPVPPTIVELNSADSATLMTLKTMRPITAAKIIRYRNALGGYLHLNQLYEIRKVDSFVIARSLPYLTIDTTLIIRLSVLNSDRLAKHPYLTFSQARRIAAYAQMHKPIQSFHQLRANVPAIPDSVWQKIIPYLTLD